MSNRTTLINTNDLEYTEEHVDSGCLASKYSIAALWPCLFKPSDIKYFIGNDENEIFKVPYLMANYLSARDNLAKRETKLRGILSPVGQMALDGFITRIETFDKTMVILDTWELWMMIVDDFDKYLIELIDDIDAGDMGLVLEQANVKSGYDEQCLYAGFEWNE